MDLSTLVLATLFTGFACMASRPHYGYLNSESRRLGPMMEEVLALRIIIPGHAATQLIECLRHRAKLYGVNIVGRPPDLIAELAGGATISLRDMIPEILGECGARHELRPRDYVAIIPR